MSHSRWTTFSLIVILGLSLAEASLGMRGPQAPIITPKDDGSGYSLTIWPPSRQVIPVRLSDCVVSAADGDGNTIEVDASGTIHRITSDELTTDSDGDMFIVGPSSAGVRAVRDGSTDGRVYSIHYVVSDHSGMSAEGVCRLQVPRNSTLVAVDSGVAACIGVGC
jgi:hypothetical protein